MKTCEVWILLRRKHEHSSTRSRTRERARARHEHSPTLEHEHESTGARAREHWSTSTGLRGALEHEHEVHWSTSTRCTRAQARGALEHEHSSTSTRWPGNQCEPSGKRHAKLDRLFFKTMWVCVRLDGSMCSECLPVVASFRDSVPPEHGPRTSAGAHTCAVVYGRAPCVPRSREHENRAAAGREKNAYA